MEKQFKKAELPISGSELITQLFECDQIKIEDLCLIIFNDIYQNFDNLNNLKIMILQKDQRSYSFTKFKKFIKKIWLLVIGYLYERIFRFASILIF